MTTEHRHTGGCLCGAVRYELTSDAPWVSYCHCSSCRKHTGAPVAALVAGPPERVRWTAGERARYESSPGRFRGFCRDCGTSLSWEAEVNGSWLALHISTFDDPSPLPPVEHVFHRDALPWVDIGADLPATAIRSTSERGREPRPWTRRCAVGGPRSSRRALSPRIRSGA